MSPATSEGGKKTRDILLQQDPDYYRKLRAKANPNKDNAGDFSKNPERARIDGAKGGKASKRGPAKKINRNVM